MSMFWLAAGLLLLLASAFLLVPLWRGRKAQAEEDRTALNVALYQERLAELTALREAGSLDPAQWQSAQAEAARELLSDTESAASGSRRLGRTLPLLLSLGVPLLAAALYWQWGASQVLQAMQDQPSLAQMRSQLEQAVRDNPQSAEAWYFLARLQMNEGQFASAATAYQQAASLAGRPPELLGQWAQALYFANGKRWSVQLQELTDEALRAAPTDVTVLGLLGIAAFEEGRFEAAVDHWQRLLAQIPLDDPSHQAIADGIAKARQQLAGQGGGQGTAMPAGEVRLKVRVELAEALRDQVRPDDSLFVFVRAVEGPPMPLAARRLTVAELPLELELTDADSMLAQLKLSSVPRVQLLARISRAGQPTAGEWIGQGEPIPNTSQSLQLLLIDSPDKPR